MNGLAYPLKTVCSKMAVETFKNPKMNQKIEIFVYLYDFLLLISVLKAPSSNLHSDQVDNPYTPERTTQGLYI
jgi:hypothetical protein